MAHTVVKWTGSQVTAHPLRCKCWDCPKCLPYRKALLVKLAKAGKANKFITITVNPKRGNSPQHRAKMLSLAWRRVVRYCRTTLKMASVEYLAIFEKTENGEPHLHIMARMPYLPQRVLSTMMNKLIGAPVVDIRKANGTEKIAYYITKYVGKNPSSYSTVKRYQFTRNWSHPTKSELKAARDPETKFFRILNNFTEYRKILSAVADKIENDWPSMLSITLHEGSQGPPLRPTVWDVQQ